MIFILSGAVLAASFFFGGGARRDIIGDLLPIILSCGLIALAYPIARPRLQEDRFFGLLLIGVLLLLALQFVPLPPSVWGAFPGRRELIEMYAQSGVSPPWASLALRQGEAARSALSILPGVALCLAVITLDNAERKALIWLVIVFALLNAPLGMLQLLGGNDSPLYIYQITNFGSAVGFFANRNHFAALFFCALPFVAVLLASKEQAAGVPTWIAGAICAGILFLGLSISGSRSALVLGGVSIVATLLYVARSQIRDLMKGQYAWVSIGIFALLMLPLALGAGLVTILERFEGEDLAEDGRWTFAKVTLGAIKDFFPAGAGLGSFQQIYQLREPANTVISPIINHAHNDWLEIAMELGLPGLILAGAFVLWLGRKILQQSSGDNIESRLARAGLVAMMLLTIHSIWDYPLRTIALMALFGVCCGLTFRPGKGSAAVFVRRGRSSKKKRKSRSRSQRGDAPSVEGVS
jgi:O-antigen ligase